MAMTCKKLLNRLKIMEKDFPEVLNEPLAVKVDDEFYTINDLLENEFDDVLDAGMPYFTTIEDKGN